MPFEDPAARFEDIVENIGRIESYCAGLDLLQFTQTQIVMDAVERCLARISEAAVKLGAEAERLCPEQPWHEIRALGNRLRHDYLGVSPPILWDTVQYDLPSLETACNAALASLKSGLRS